MTVPVGMVPVPERLFGEGFSFQDILVYRAIVRRRAWAIKDLSRASGVSYSRVHTALRRLKDAGVVEVVQRGTSGKVNVYHVPGIDGELQLVS